MKNEPERRVETLFHAASERAAGAEREAYLDGACAEDADLRSRVEALLAAHEQASGFLESPAVEGAREGPGSSIGPYKLLQEIGEGGMGVVYMAQQERPVRRKVALKVIKLGMDTKQVIARFEAERQALAMMESENIARVLDAGATETGRPYFVMELVRGVPISDYCDTHKLGTQARLELFVDVCRAVQHAHQKGIIHRDLKPSNVLVTSHDGTPIPKIIDFGVAKATHQRLTERTLFTEYHQFIGTPEYMSPEQAEMSGLDVDTRSDIYSLGVLLYQLLTGTTPVDPKTLRTAGFEEMTRMIREEEAQAPSTRISKLEAQGTGIPAHGGAAASELARHVRGDLDWIVMKALEKDRTRRYETAAAFAEDIQRHLGDQPVEAGRPGPLYRLHKFVRRNRRAVLAGSVLAVVVGLGLAGTTAGFLRARDEAQRSGTISASLQEVLSMTDPARGAGREDIERVRGTVREVFGSDHGTYAAVLGTLAVQMHDAGDFEAAVKLARESIEAARASVGDAHPSVAIGLGRLGRFLRSSGDDEGAETALRESLSLFADLPTDGHLAANDVRMDLADLLANRGEYLQADELLGVALEALRASPTPAHYRILEALERRSIVQLNSPNADVLPTMRAVYEETHTFYPDGSPMLAMAALGLGKTLFQRGQRDEAEGYLREAIERFRACERERGMYFVIAADTLFQILRGRNDEESVLEADELLLELVSVARQFWNAEEVAGNLKYLARRMAQRGRHSDALVAALDAFSTLVAAGHPQDDHDSLRGDMAELAMQVSMAPSREPAEYERALTALDMALDERPEHPFLLAAKGVTLVRLGDHVSADELLAGVEEELREEAGDMQHKVGAIVHCFRAHALHHMNQDEGAREQLELMRTAMAGRTSTDAQSVMDEIEALVEQASPPPGDD